MKKLVSIELKKVIPYLTFWVILALYVALIFVVFFLAHTIKLNNKLSFLNLKSYYTFPDLWHTLTYIASFFTLLLGILVIILITNEFTFRTARQNIIDGLSKADFLAGKLLLLLLIALFATAIVFITGMVNGLLQTDNPVTSMILAKMDFVVAYFVQTMAYLCFALFTGMLVKKSGLAIGIFLLYSKIIEPLAGWKMPDAISNYLPFHTISGLIQNPALKMIGFAVPESPLGIHFAFTVGYSLLFIAGSYLLLSRRDL